MKRVLALALCALMLLASGAGASAAISAETFSQAQYIPTLLESAASYAYTIFEYAEDGTLESSEYYWFGKMPDGSFAVYCIDGDNCCRYYANGIVVSWDPQTRSCETWAYVPSAYAAELEDLFGVTMFYLQDEIVPFEVGDALLTYAYSTRDMQEYCSFDAETLRMSDYRYELIRDGQALPVEQIVARADEALVLPQDLQAVLDGESCAIGVNFEDGTQAQYAVPAGIPMYLMGETPVALAEDAELTQPMDYLLPVEDAQVWVLSEAE